MAYSSVLSFSLECGMQTQMPGQFSAIAPTAYPKAALGRRFVASFIDGLVAAAPILVAGLALGIAGEGAQVVALPLLGIGGIWSLWYGLTKDGNGRGAGYGKRAMGLTVVQQSGQPCTKGQSAIRQLVMAAWGLIPLVGWLVEPIVLIVRPDGKRTGDLLVGTQVTDARL